MTKPVEDIDIPVPWGHISDTTAKETENSKKSTEKVKKKNYVCDYCDIVYSSYSSFRQHAILKHFPVYLLRKTIKKMKKKKINEKIKNYSCNICDRKFEFNGKLLKHKRKKHGSNKNDVKNYSCDICDRKFEFNGKLLKHKRKKHGSNKNDIENYSCDICDRKFEIYGKLLDHKRKEHGSNENLVKNYSCDICGKKHEFNCRLLKHLKLKHGIDRSKIKNYSCDVCDRKYETNSKLLDHKRKIHGSNKSKIKNYSCDICDKKYEFPSQLFRHVKMKHESHSSDGETNSSIWHKCEDCDCSFFLWKSLLRHYRIKHPGLPYPINKNKINVQSVTSGNEKINVQSVTSGNEKINVQSVTSGNEKINVQSVTSGNEKINVQSVTNGNENLICELCHIEFHKKGNLKYHIVKYHIKENCENSIKKLQNFRECSICNFKFIGSNALFHHYIRAHNIEIKCKTLNFNNYNDFLTWKEKEEKDCMNRYTAHYGPKRKSGVELRYFYCHRTHPYQYKGNGQRCIKQQGSKKYGRHCPSRILVKIIDENNINVKYIMTHVGHESEVCHLTLSLGLQKVPKRKLKRVKKSSILLNGNNQGDSHEIFKNKENEIEPSKSNESATETELYIESHDFFVINNNDITACIGTNDILNSLPIVVASDVNEVPKTSPIILSQEDLPLHQLISVPENCEIVYSTSYEEQSTETSSFDELKQNYMNELVQFINVNINSGKQLHVAEEITKSLMDSIKQSSDNTIAVPNYDHTLPVTV